MNKKIALLPLIISLTACVNQVTSDNKAVTKPYSEWEHSTPQIESEPSNQIEKGTGWVPEGQEAANQQTTVSDFTPMEIKPVVYHRVVKDDIYTAGFEPNPEVVRYDRYLLVDSKPEDGQKYLLEQIISVDMKGFGLTVEQGMWNALSNTGYSLCTPYNQAVASLFSLQLPKVHYKFGPVRLRDAMQMLAGAAYELTTNDAIRQICYAPRAGELLTRPEPKLAVYATDQSL